MISDTTPSHLQAGSACVSRIDAQAVSSRGGFTLIELLVVISIISLLIAILLPVMGAAREAARELKCLTNVKQLKTAYISHATDSKGYYSYTGNSGDDWFSVHYTQGYITTPEVVICPSTVNTVDVSAFNAVISLPQPDNSSPFGFVPGPRTPVYTDLQDTASNRDDNSGGHSYETFSWTQPGVYPGGLTVNSRQMFNERLVESQYSASDTYIILDADEDPTNGGPYGGETVYNNLPDDASNNHGGKGLNVSFLDGHAEFVTRDDWVETTVRSGVMGKINVARATVYEPRLVASSRTDGGTGKEYSLAP